MKKIRILSFVMMMVLVVLAVAGCADKNDGNTDNTGVVYQDIDLKDAVARTDFTSVYEKIGSKVTIDMVTEDEDGFAYVTVDGIKYELGMDFLSMAMVYNTKVTDAAKAAGYETEEDVYNEWWKLYVQRWNYLVPEVPLYSNEYYDLYSAKITDFVTSPYWDPIDAIIAAKVTTPDNSVILGSSTDLSGAFRASSWGKSNPGASDLDIENLTSGYSTVQTTKDGSMIWNMSALAAQPTSALNEDGSLTYTIKIKDNLVFSDNSPITAKNYIVSVLANSTAVSVAAGATGNSGLQLVGYDEFKAYEGADKEGASKYFAGVKLLGDYEFSVTFLPDYAGYYYSMAYASFSPVPMALYTGNAGVDIIVDDTTKACGLSDKFYEKVEKDGAQVFARADEIKANLKWNSNLPWSGPYVVESYDTQTLTAVLKRNPLYPGDDARGVASIQTITYVKAVEETQLDKFKKGEIDILAGVMGAAETKAALTLVSENSDKYKETHYERAGYGKIGFRCDFGPTNFTEVRQAIMYTINRPEFAQTYTGGYGSVVDGPYYAKAPSFLAVKDEIKLNKYTYSKDAAIDVLEEGGWIYNVEGKTFDASKDAVRYKKLSGYELSEPNLQYSSIDGKYKTVKIDGAYYMPLVINWYGTQPNDVTDTLITAWQESATATSEIGMYITYTSCDFSTGLYGEYLHISEYGWDGTWRLSAINFATGFTSAIYDQSWYWTIDPSMYDDYSNNYLMDPADFWADYQK